MRDQTAFEARLTEAFDRYAAAAPGRRGRTRADTLDAAADAARPTLADRWAGLFGARRLAPIVLLVALAATAAVAGALLLRLLDQPPRVFGTFEPVPGGNLPDPVWETAPLPTGAPCCWGRAAARRPRHGCTTQRPGGPIRPARWSRAAITRRW